MEIDPSPAFRRIRFGEFEVDARSHELLRSGRRIRLQEKSFLVLQELLKRPGDVVTREELAAALWPKEYFVDAEHGLNTAVRRLREALGDSAEEARYVETLPKRGYRFIGAIEEARTFADAQASESSAPPDPPPSPAVDPEAPARGSRRGTLVAVAILVAASLALGAALVVRSRSHRKEARGGAAAETPATTDTVEELLQRARYLRNVKRFDEAKKFVEEALELDPTNADALGSLALSLLGEGRDEQARATAQRALELDPNTGEAHRALAVLERGAGNFVAVESHLRRAVDAAPTDSKSRNRLARHLLECGRNEEALAQIRETRRIAPDDPDVQNIWMEYALRTGDFESAIREGESWIAIWAKQIEGQPTPTVRDMLGLAYVGARRYDDALAQFRAIDPDDDLRVALALGYAGKIREARAILDAREKEKTVDPGRSGAMAMAYVVIGDFDRAFAQLERQLAAGWYPSWLNCALFHPIHQDRRWVEFARRLDREFFSGEERSTLPSVSTILQSWPRPTKRALTSGS